jgi:3-dehydroquinate dehydratase / shikimate dehydrogenase
MRESASAYASRIRRFRLPRICIAVVGGDVATMIERAESLVRDNPLIELRLDYLSQPLAALPKLKNFIEVHPEVTFVATCRRAANGGKFKGPIAAELAVLRKAAESGFQLADLEVQSAEALKVDDLKDLYNRVGLILSYHDFRATRKLSDQLAVMKRFPADFYKLVSTATNLHDNVVMMKFLEAHSGQHEMVGLCMGEQGIISRVLGVRAGSIFTFASAVRGEETALGQVPAGELRDVYRIDMVDQATQVYGVVGDPVAHSMSPVMMNAAFRRETVNAVYLALHAKSLKDLLACVQEIPIRGLSVTMPYKQEILEALENSDALTRQIGACNTVVRGAGGQLYGFNTDVAGIVAPLEQRLHLAGVRILIVGAGGSARAAAFGLKARGAEVFITNRTPERGQTLARQAKAKYLKRADVAKQQFDVILNATPLGMNGNKQSPLSEDELNTKYVFDLVYNPIETPLLKMARAKDLQVISGLEAFVQQGARQFEIWTGKPAPIAEMAYVVSKALERQAAQEASQEPKLPVRRAAAKPQPNTPIRKNSAKPAKSTRKK